MSVLIVKGWWCVEIGPGVIYLLFFIFVLFYFIFLFFSSFWHEKLCHVVQYSFQVRYVLEDGREG